MKSPAAGKKRKLPAERRADIVAAASRIARDEGLDSLTLRRVAQALGVVPGLVHHYFRDVDELAAAAFGYAVAAERDAILAALDPAASGLANLRKFLAHLLSPASDDISLLWLDAWQASRRRPALRAEVATQMWAWQNALAKLIQEGGFRVADAQSAAARVLALIDGLSVRSAVRQAVEYDSVREMVIRNVERELGLRAGAIRKEGLLF